jgi:predicted NBD/HSP70 family sugar kinase
MDVAAPVAGRFAGVEIGGTKVIVTLADGLDIVEQHNLPTTSPDATLGAAVERLAAWDDAAPLAAIGIASFGPIRVDPAVADYGTMLYTTKPGWTGARVVHAFAERFACPIALDTDVNGAGIAEAALGAGQGCKTIVYLTIGTGVGGGVIVGGRPVIGRLHPEIGHLCLRLPRRLHRGAAERPGAARTLRPRSRNRRARRSCMGYGRIGPCRTVRRADADAVPRSHRRRRQRRAGPARPAGACNRSRG